MVEVKAATWDIQQIAFREKLGKAACGEGDWPFNIVSYECLNVWGALSSQNRNAQSLDILPCQSYKLLSSYSDPDPSRQIVSCPCFGVSTFSSFPISSKI
jgi:hypothetical protein